MSMDQKIVSTIATVSFLCFFFAFTPARSFTISEEDSPMIAAMLAEEGQYGPYYRNMYQKQQMSNNAAFLRALYSSPTIQQPQVPAEHSSASDIRLYRASRSNGKPTFIRFGKRVIAAAKRSLVSN